jgi:hypothetical protein
VDWRKAVKDVFAGGVLARRVGGDVGKARVCTGRDAATSPLLLESLSLFNTASNSEA